MFHANYDVVEIGDNYIYIEESNEGKTVTNDAEWVIEQLHEDYDLAGKRVFYKDCYGEVDEITHVNGVFKGFETGKYFEGGFNKNKIKDVVWNA